MLFFSYELMLNCWRELADERPTFTEICAQLMPILEDSNLQYSYVDAIKPEIQIEEDDEVEI